MATIATSVVSTVAYPMFRLLSIGGQKYYYRHVSEGESIYETLVNILHAFKDDNQVHSICRTFNNIEIAADMLCFRNVTDDWGWSDNARMKVRVQYNQMTHSISVMCKKQYQLTSFINKFCKEDFNPAAELKLVGIS